MVPATEFFSDKDSVPEEDVYLSLHEVAPDLEHDQSVKKQITLCEYFLREGVFFKRLLGKETHPLAPTYAFPVPKNSIQAVEQAEQVADFERSRLGLGSEPIADISNAIYFQGIWASRIDLPADVSGLFFNHPNIGLVILANASLSRDRIQFSFAHEYAHALFDRNRGSSISNRANSSELVEKRANAFASAFLLPKDGIHKTLLTLGKGASSRLIHENLDCRESDVIHFRHTNSDEITLQDIAYIALRFGVSYRAALIRMKNLQYISKRKLNNLLQSEKSGQQYLDELNSLYLSDENGSPRESVPELRREIAVLALEAYRREEISRGRFIELIKVARESGNLPSDPKLFSNLY